MSNENNNAALQEVEGCPGLVHQNVCIQGKVTLTPNVVAGETEFFCIDAPIIGRCPGNLVETSTFTVARNICVQIPLTFTATAEAVSDGLVCHGTNAGPCPTA